VRRAIRADGTPDETALVRIASLPPEKLLIDWLHHLLKQAGADRPQIVLKDSELYAATMNAIEANAGEDSFLPAPIDLGGLRAEADLMARASIILSQAKGMGVSLELDPLDIVSGNPRCVHRAIRPWLAGL
jgi:hypothetical protein